MKGNIKIWMPVMLAVVLVMGIQMGMLLSGGNKISFSGNGKPNTMDEVISYVSAKYVDTVNLNSINQKGIEALLLQLDPHSVFIPYKRLLEVNQQMKGSFDGIGIEFFRVFDTITVVNVFQGGPSAQAGIKKGDKIVSVNDDLVTGKNYTDDSIKGKLKGAGGTKVKLGIRRRGIPDTKYFTIIRGKIPLSSVTASYMISSDIGYIKMERFSETTEDEMHSSLNKLKESGMKKLILDLRGNGGGVLEIAVYIADEFLSEKKLVVYTVGRVYPKKEYYTGKIGLFEKGEICVLIDDESASASEILAGALQDYDRATIVGRRSFGKGLVQEQYTLSDSSGLRLTIARYFTPSGRSIQKSYKDGTENYYHEMVNRYGNGELTSRDSIKLTDTTKYYTESGRVVYGGGGIVPDVFVSIDTSLFGASISGLSQTLIQESAYQFAVNYSRVFSLSDAKLIEPVLKINFNSLNAMQKKQLLNTIESLSARMLNDENEYFRFLNKTDNDVLKAISLLEKK